MSAANYVKAKWGGGVVTASSLRDLARELDAENAKVWPRPRNFFLVLLKFLFHFNKCCARLFPGIVESKREQQRPFGVSPARSAVCLNWTSRIKRQDR